MLKNLDTSLTDRYWYAISGYEVFGCGGSDFRFKNISANYKLGSTIFSCAEYIYSGGLHAITGCEADPASQDCPMYLGAPTLLYDHDF